MSTREQATADNTHPSQAQPEAQRKTGSSIGDKASGLVNIIHGTGEVIRGQALEAGDLGHGHGNGKAIAEAGREEVQRGLDKIEGKHARTSAATDTPNGGGPHHDGTGAAPVRDANAPQAPAAAPHADPNAGKARGDAQDTNGYPGLAGKVTGAGAGTAGAAGGAVGGGGPGSELRTNEQIAAPAPAPPPAPARGDRPAAAAATDSDGPNIQRDTAGGGVGSMTVAPGDAGKQTRPSTNLPLSSGETGVPRSDRRTDSDEPFTAFAPPAAPGDRGPNVQRDTDIAGVESRLAPGDAGKQTRPTTTNLPLSGERVGQPEGQSFGTGAQMEQRNDRPVDVGTV